MFTIDGNTRYVHRANSDGTFDSICLTCYRTAGVAPNEAELERYEDAHQCDPRDIQDSMKKPSTSAMAEDADSTSSATHKQ